MSGCTGCLCTRQRSSQSRERNPYTPLSMEGEGEEELMIVSDKHQQLVNLSLTHEGLVVVKRKPGSLHSLKLGNPSSTSTRLIPYLSLLSLSLSPSTSSSSHLTIQALVPSSSKQDLPDNSKTKLWKLSGQVQPFHSDDDDQLAGGGRRCELNEESLRRVQEWIKLGEERAYKGVKRNRKFHVIINPIGGKGLAKKAWETSVKPVLDASRRSTYSISYTGPLGSPTHAYALGASHDPLEFDALVSVSGDGIVHELLNGLASQGGDGGKKGRKALRESPVVHVSCGSGNALATSVVGNERVGDWKWCTLVGLKGNPTPIDLCSVTQKGGKRLFSFLTQAFGLMADLDLGTEHLRFLGDFRFTLGYIQGALTRRKYPMKLTVLVENSSKQSIARRYNESLSHGTPTTTEEEEDQGDGIPELEFGYPDEPLGEEVEEEMRKKRYLDHLPKDGEMDGEGKWWTIDLMGNTTRGGGRTGKGKGKDKGVFFLYGGKMPWISKDVMLFPPASPSSGFLDLCLVAPMSPLEALTAMDSAETGSLYNHPSLLYLQTKAYRLSFPHAANSEREEKELGYVSIDGEKVRHEDFNVEVHKGLARVMVLEKRFAGSKPLQGV